MLTRKGERVKAARLPALSATGRLVFARQQAAHAAPTLAGGDRLGRPGEGGQHGSNGDLEAI